MTKKRNEKSQASPARKDTSPANGTLNASGNACKKCGLENPEAARFCMSCGAPLDVNATKKGGQSLDSQYMAISLVGGLSLLLVLFLYYNGFIVPIEEKTSIAAQEHEHNHPQQAENQPETLPFNPPSESAIAEVRTQLEADPDNFDLNVQMGNLMFDSRKFAEAIPFYQRAIKQAPNSPNVIVDLGVSYFNIQKLDEAKNQFALALQANPNHVNALYNMGVVAMQEREPDKLIQYWTRLQQVAPESPQAIKAGQILQDIHQNVQQFSGNDDAG